MIEGSRDGNSSRRPNRDECNWIGFWKSCWKRNRFNRWLNKSQYPINHIYFNFIILNYYWYFEDIGHTEAASGLAGIIKLALTLKNGVVPPNIHFEDPNPNIPFSVPFFIFLYLFYSSNNHDRIYTWELLQTQSLSLLIPTNFTHEPDF